MCCLIVVGVVLCLGHCGLGPTPVWVASVCVIAFSTFFWYLLFDAVESHLCQYDSLLR
jgi:hypothetical protein